MSYFQVPVVLLGFLAPVNYCTSKTLAKYWISISHINYETKSERNLRGELLQNFSSMVEETVHSLVEEIAVNPFTTDRPKGSLHAMYCLYKV